MNGARVAVIALALTTIAMLDVFGTHWQQDARGAWYRTSPLGGYMETDCWSWITPDGHQRYSIARVKHFDPKSDECVEWREPWPH